MTTEKTYRILSYGGIGDALLTTPVFKALKKQFPDCKIKVYCLEKKHLSIYRNNPYIDKLSTATFWELPLERIIYFVYPKYIERRYYNNGYALCSPSKFYQKHASKIIAELIGVELADETLEIFLSEKEKLNAQKILSKYHNPIIIHVTSITSSNQNWPAENWEKLIDSMPDHTFIQLGETSEQKINGAIDFLGKTTLREAISILACANSFVGVVSSLAHASNAVGIPGVVLYGPSSPAIWGHKNNINLFKELPCAPCIDILFSSKCPYECLCMKEISVEEVKQALELQLKKRKGAKIQSA